MKINQDSHAISMILAITTALLFTSCGTSKQESSNAELPAGSKKQGITSPLPISPNNCRIVGTIMQINSTQAGLSKNDPCSKAPCSAVVRIDSVIGYGSAFPKTLSPHEQLRVKFAYTLESTKENLPEVNPALPGLQTKSRFVANIVGTQSMGQGEPTFTIYDYEKQ